MNTKIVFFMDPTSFKGRLMKTFTGCYSYHCGILMEGSQKFYDMFWMRRRRSWDDVLHQVEHDKAVLKIIDSPIEMQETYLENKILNENTHYGVKDYIRFGFRWFYHLVGKYTKNSGGLICSEMVYEDLKSHGWTYYFKEVPSPCDLIRAFSILGFSSKLAFGSKIDESTKSMFLSNETRIV